MKRLDPEEVVAKKQEKKNETEIYDNCNNVIGHKPRSMRTDYDNKRI
jgi:hypothetical protein